MYSRFLTFFFLSKEYSCLTSYSSGQYSYFDMYVNVCEVTIHDCIHDCRHQTEESAETKSPLRHCTCVTLSPYKVSFLLVAVFTTVFLLSLPPSKAMCLLADWFVLWYHNNPPVHCLSSL